jgi:hypothetical protein
MARARARAQLLFLHDLVVANFELHRLVTRLDTSLGV